MIQFNLLPDVKQNYIKSQRLKRTTVTITLLVAGGALTIMVLLGMAVVLQKQHLKGVGDDIQAYSQQLKEVEDLEKVLTVQNQMNSLPGLHDKKPVASRLFDYLGQIVPDKINIAHLEVDFAGKTMTITGSTDSLGQVNKFVDTLKFTTFKATDDAEGVNAFSNVVLSSFGRNGKDKEGANYTIKTTFNGSIFDSKQTVKLTVPNITTSRSETERPGALFKEQAKPSDETQVNQ